MHSFIHSFGNTAMHEVTERKKAIVDKIFYHQKKSTGVVYYLYVLDDTWMGSSLRKCTNTDGIKLHAKNWCLTNYYSYG